MSYENNTQNSSDELDVGSLNNGALNSSSVQGGKATTGSTELPSTTVTKSRKRTKTKHVFNNRNMLNSQMQKASLAELKSASEALAEMIRTREEEERLAKEKLQRDREAAAKLLEQAKAGGIDPAVLAEVFAV